MGQEKDTPVGGWGWPERVLQGTDGRRFLARACWAASLLPALAGPAKAQGAALSVPPDLIVVALVGAACAIGFAGACWAFAERRGAARLRPRFVIHQRRHERSVADGTSRVLVTLDEVAVHAGRRTVGSFSALEIEHTSGDEGLLRAVAAGTRLAASSGGAARAARDPAASPRFARGR